MFKPFPPPTCFSLEELLNRIKILKSQDFLPIFGKKRNAAIGESFETYLGLSTNSLRLADWGEYELKTTSQGLNSKISLFNTKWNYKDDYSARKLVIQFGKDHHSEHLDLHVIRIDWDVSFSNDPLDKLYINFDIEFKNLNLKFENRLLASIKVSNLKNWFDMKFKNLVLISVKNLQLNTNNGFCIGSAIILKNSSFKRFINLVKANQIQLSFRMMLVQPGTEKEKFKNRGSGFRAKQSILEKLYNVKRMVV